jgi:DNA-directed RNA polymerase specialized sigma24 family protein
MRLWQELSYQEIAEITGKSPASLKMSFSRLIRNLSQSELILISVTIKTLLEL